MITLAAKRIEPLLFMKAKKISDIAAAPKKVNPVIAFSGTAFSRREFLEQTKHLFLLTTDEVNKQGIIRRDGEMRVI